MALKALLAIPPALFQLLAYIQISGPEYEAPINKEYSSKLWRHWVQENLRAGFIRIKVGEVYNTQSILISEWGAYIIVHLRLR
jgi:hypothetical protein